MRSFIFLPIIFLAWFCCCSTDKENSIVANQQMQAQEISGTLEVTEVTVSGEENAYTFNVTIKSADTGCDQYADWWEILDLEGNLIYRRILAHSHVDEQPFTRGGGPVEITEGQEVYIRGHMNNSGYSNSAFKGSVAIGFTAFDLAIDFAEGLASTEPLPQNCAF